MGISDMKQTNKVQQTRGRKGRGKRRRLRGRKITKADKREDSEGKYRKLTII